MNKEKLKYEAEDFKVFARKNDNGNYDLLDYESGESITRTPDELTSFYPVGSTFSSLYEHPEGIEISEEDVLRLNIEIE